MIRNRILTIALFGAILLLSGIYLFARDWYGRIDTSGWANVPGQVVDSRIRGNSPGEDDAVRHPSITYRYSIDGRIYRASQIWLAETPDFASEAEAQAFLNDYPVGKDVIVHHDPGNPERAALVLDQPLAYGGIAMGVSGLLLLGLALVLRRRRNADAATG